MGIDKEEASKVKSQQNYRISLGDTKSGSPGRPKVGLGIGQERRTCTCCGTSYETQEGNFLKTLSPLYQQNKGYLPFCIKCTEQYYTELLKFYSFNEEHALEHLCRICDWYYDVHLSSNLQVGNNTLSATSYGARITRKTSVQRGETYLDTVAQMANSDKIMTEEEAKAVILSEEDAANAEAQNIPVIEKRTIDMFGTGFSPEEYRFLQDQYDDWRTRYECNTKAQEELFKSLCVNRCMAQRALKDSNPKQLNDLDKSFQDLLGSAKIKPNQSDDSAFADQNTFGTLIERWEKERPISEPREEWKDVDGIQNYISTYYLGHMSENLHIENNYSEQYRAEIGKYTVLPPAFDEDMESLTTSIFDKYSTKGGDKDAEQADEVSGEGNKE